MAIADWIREATERRRQKLRREGYRQGYADSEAGRPHRYLADSEHKPPPPPDAESGQST